MLPDEPNDEERQEELPQDGQTPFRPADDSPDGAASDDTHPDTDTDVDQQELYDAGQSAASSGADEPHDNPTVIDYKPPNTEDTDMPPS